MLLDDYRGHARAGAGSGVHGRIRFLSFTDATFFVQCRRSTFTSIADNA